MIGPEPPKGYQPEAWRGYISELEAYPDYPWRKVDIESARAKLSFIEAHLSETGNLPTAWEMLERAKTLQAANPEISPVEGR